MYNFDEYIRLGEGTQKEKSEIWQIAIGLQKVDNLEISDYLIEVAKENIEGKITFEEVKNKVRTYYQIQSERNELDIHTEEADKVAVNIAEVLSEKAFTFSPAELIVIHKRLFDDYEFAGKVRNYNISKKEWVLNGESVLYGSSDSILATLDYDFRQEKSFRYKGLTKQEIVEHIAKFVSGIWQIHPFLEGNTRATAVFTIKYLRSFGFVVDNTLFFQHSWYFRNALVRSNYENYENNIFLTMKFLNRFFANLLLDKEYILKNREMHIYYDTVNSENDTVNVENDTVNAESDTVNSENDTVNVENDTVNAVNDTVNVGNDTVKSENDAVLILIKENIYITATEVAEKLQISLSTAKRKIKILKDSKKIKRIGSDKAGHWEV